MYESSVVRRTDAAEAPPYLEPWIQWPTVHFGVGREQHGSFHLGDGRKYEGPGLAQLLSDAGVRVGVFGSMNTNYRALSGYYLPDPWDARGRAFPPELSAFSDFVARQVQESSRDDARIGPLAALRFVRFLLAHGLRAGTVASIVRQLVAERRNPKVRWKRAMLLDALAFDVFSSLNATYRGRFATFFSNSVAHFQHYHWRDMSPAIFDHQSDDDDGTHRDAIREGYQRNDAIVGRVLRSHPKSTIVFATGLSQQPWLETAKCAYRPRKFADLFAFAGVTGGHVEPLMAEEFRIVGTNPERTALQLRALTSSGTPIFNAAVVEGGVHAGCSIYDGDARVLRNVVDGPTRSATFGDLFYRLPAMRSGRHHPIGALWIRDGSPHRIEDEPVPLESIAPTILSMFALTPPASFAPPLPRVGRVVQPVA